MSCINKEHVALSLPGFFQVGIKFIFQKGFLLVRVSLRRNVSNFEPFQPHVFEKLGHLSAAAPNAGQLFNPLASFVDALGRTNFKLDFQLLTMVLHGTFWTIEIQHLQRFNTADLVHPQVAPQGLLTDPHDASNFLMLVTNGFQIHRFQALANSGMGMIMSLIMQLLDHFRTEIKLDYCCAPAFLSEG